MEAKRTLIINPGSTSTKIAVYDGKREVFVETLRHTDEELAPFEHIADQYDFRKEVIERALASHGVEVKGLDAVVGRGGLLKPISGGVWEVNDAMAKDLHNPPLGDHASNLGGLIAREIAAEAGVRAFIVDPVVVDEMEDLARLAGHPEFERVSIFHALNQKAVARQAALNMGKTYDEVNLIVAHMGGGISVGAHKQGRVIDVNNALNGDGPYSPERSGGLPAGQLMKMCFSGKVTAAEVGKKLKGEGGLRAYLGTADVVAVKEKAAAGDPDSRLYYEGMAYQVSKEIAALGAVLKGKVDGIVLTGGIAYNEDFTEWVRERVGFIAPVFVFPGENELEALRDGALRVLAGTEEAHVYS